MGRIKKRESLLKSYLHGSPLGIWQFYLTFIVAVLVLVGVILFIVVIIHHRRTTVYIPDFVNINEFDPFQPEIEIDFDNDSSKEPKIPRIIHQTWKDENIPPKFINNIKSFIKHNPNWTYYLWTDKSADEFIREHHPELLYAWDGYLYQNQPVRRADAIRYVVLFHFGGLYIDMDVVNYRPMDGAITKHGCIIIPEPFEQSILRAYTPFLMSNAVMLCRPKHPFFKQLIDNLVTFSNMQAIGDATGPGFLTTQYKVYFNLQREKDKMILYDDRKLSSKDDNSPFFYKGNLPLSDEASIYVPNSEYFLVSLDDEAFGGYSKTCKRFEENTLLMKRLCANIKRKGVHRQPNKYSFTDHIWIRTYGEFFYGYWYNFIWKTSVYSYYAATSIYDIVPHVQIYKPSTNQSNESITTEERDS